MIGTRRISTKFDRLLEFWFDSKNVSNLNYIWTISTLHLKDWARSEWSFWMSSKRLG